ncbi:MAG: aldo/keto reductase [Candidatus Binatia bacterium]
MERKPFAWTGVRVAVVGQGTWHMGESWRRRKREAAALALGLDLGLTHIDTAEMYGSGEAEEVVGMVLQGRRRSDVFLVSKVLPEHASYPGTIRAADQSLRRLRTDYLDLYLLHWPGRHPIAETMGAMQELVAAGKLRFIGVSNFDINQLRAAIAALTRERLACNQVLYNLRKRGIERDIIPFCAERDIAVVGYTPFGGFPRRGTEGLRVLAEIGARYGKTPRQVALRFLTRAPAVFAIPKASDPQHVRENAGATGFALTHTDVARLDREWPAPRHRVPLAMG